MFLLKPILQQLSVFLLENLLAEDDIDPEKVTEEEKVSMNDLDKVIIFNPHKSYSETKAKIIKEVGKEMIEDILKEKKGEVTTEVTTEEITD